MLLNRQTLDGIANGQISLVFRRWKRPTVRSGGSLKTAIGVLAINSVEPILTDEIVDQDARRAGYSSRGVLLAELKSRPGTKLYRIALCFAGADPRIALREQASLTDEDVTELRRRLARLDKNGRHGPWTIRVLKLIGEQPETLASTLAEAAGYEKQWFKSGVRKLKKLGLTESLAVGYRLSPRGRAFLDHRVRGGE